MTQEQLEGSELIASFMGWVHEGHLRNHYSVPTKCTIWGLTQTCYRVSEMKWHSDWNWTMAAWDKIRSTVFWECKEDYPEWFQKWAEAWQMYTHLSKLDAAFSILLSAIQEYNNTQSNQS